jgi:protease II
VDVVTTMSDASVPLTTLEYDEWGNPAVKREYDYMLSYSPYDNVGQKSYPAMFVTAGFYDSQVSYAEPAKWVAKLRASNIVESTRMTPKCHLVGGHDSAALAKIRRAGTHSCAATALRSPERRKADMRCHVNIGVAVAHDRSACRV